MSLHGVRRSGTKHIYRVWGVNLCLGRLRCDNVWSRPRKSSVPQARPFTAEESRPQTVPVQGWLALRAASTSPVSLASVQELGRARWSNQGTRSREQWRMGTKVGSRAQGRSPLSARVPGKPQFGYWLQRTGRASSVGHGVSPESTPSRVSPSHSFTLAEECDGETLRHPFSGNRPPAV